MIIASLREWQTFARVAGCDAFTAPCAVIEEFISKADVRPEQIQSCLGTNYAENLGIEQDALAELGEQRIGRLYRIEDEFLQFLHEFCRRPEFAQLNDGDKLFNCFDRAGFGDLFYAPSSIEWDQIGTNKLPDLHGQLVKSIPLDTLYSLLADANFEKHQNQMDNVILKRISC